MNVYNRCFAGGGHDGGILALDTVPKAFKLTSENRVVAWALKERKKQSIARAAST
jgi:hypothetical protein